MRATECSPARERGVHRTVIFAARETGGRASVVHSRGLDCFVHSEPTVTLRCTVGYMMPSADADLLTDSLIVLSLVT